MAPGPLLKGRETRLADRMTVINLVLFQQPVADQKIYPALADFDRRDHDNSLGAALPEPSCADGGCGFICHVTSCYYATNKGFSRTLRRGFHASRGGTADILTGRRMISDEELK
jgi:hypothetical protein